MAGRKVCRRFMIFEWMSDPAAWAGLATLIVIEIVLGIDNLVFIAILADKLPPEQRAKARYLGLSLALIMRLGLLASISWIVTLTYPVFTIFGNEISWRDIILIGGGAFLLLKGTLELHERIEGGQHNTPGNAAHAMFWQVIAQIIVLDAVFSLDSVITAVGMVQHLSIMVIAVIIAVGVMMLASRPLMDFVSRHPTVVILCLGFLLMIGFSLIVEGFGVHVPKEYLYAAIGFSVLIELANQLSRRNVQKRVRMMDMRQATASAVLRLLRGGATAEASQEVAAIVSNGGTMPTFTPQESSMIERVLTLGERPARSIMVPRTELKWLDVEDDAETNLRTIRESGRSRFPVVRGSPDDVLGIVQAKDLLAQHASGQFDLQKALQQPPVVPESLPILRLLERFKDSNVHMALVVDEHGTLEGVVTPTDILIEIAGDLPENAEDREPESVLQDDGSYLIDARMSVADVERLLETEGIDRKDYTTLAGFILAELGHLPVEGEVLAWKDWTFEVSRLDGHRIDRVVAMRRQANPSED